MVDAGVGDEAFTGMLSSVSTITTAISSLAFGMVYKKMKNAVYLPALFVLGLCFLAMAFFPSPLVTIASVAVAGLMWPFYFCYFYTRCTELEGRHGHVHRRLLRRPGGSWLLLPPHWPHRGYRRDLSHRMARVRHHSDSGRARLVPLVPRHAQEGQRRDGGRCACSLNPY